MASRPIRSENWACVMVIHLPSKRLFVRSCTSTGGMGIVRGPAGNGPEVLIDGPNVVIGHILQSRPGHDLQDLAGVIRIFSRRENMPELLFAQAGRFPTFVRGEIARDKGTEGRSTGKIEFSIELFRLPQIGVVSRGKCRAAVARGTASLRIDDVAPQANQKNVFVFKIQRDGGDSEAYSNLGFLLLGL